MADATVPRPTDSGMVTVESAIALAGLVTVLVFAIACLVAVLDQLRCTDAAREAARLVARGDAGRARDAALRIAPGSRLSVQRRGDEVTVDVRAEPAGGLLPGVQLDARAFAVAEPGVADQGVAERTSGR